MTTDQPPITAPRPKSKLKIETEIDNINYHLVPHQEDFLDPNWFSPRGPGGPGGDLVPVTVVSCPPDTDCTADYLRSVYSILSKDDVWTPSFLDNVVIFSAAPLDLAAATFLGSWHMTSFKDVPAASPHPTGPYILTLGRTWQPWRIYPDHAQTMMLTFRPGPNGTHEEYASSYTTGGTSVLVPSRAYSQPSATRPLSGLRFATKDMFDVATHKTSCGSRAYAELRGPAPTTAPCIQRLVDLGAVLLGKLKLATFIIRELPGENFEFAPPWNPRGDGFLTPEGSSSGSGAAIAAYPWLDMTVASDTNGSSRLPAHFNGCHGIRLSTDAMDAISRDGMLGFYPLYDAPALFTRDIQALTAITRAWLSPPSPSAPSPASPPKPFTSILVPSEYTASLAPKQLALVQSVAEALAAVLGTKVTPMSLAARWEAERPAGSGDHGPLEAWLQDVAAVPYFCDAVEGYRAFAGRYEARFGRRPYLNREMVWRWERVARYSRADRDALFARLTLYKSWLLQSIFAAAPQHASSSSSSNNNNNNNNDISTTTGGNLLVYPVEPGGPVYRDQEPGEKLVFAGLEGTNIAPMTGGAEVSVVPGETGYLSRITGNEERMPFAVSVIGRPGCDVQLLELVAVAMERAGLPCKLATGKSIYFENNEKPQNV